MIRRGKLTKVQDRALRDAYRRYERATAYGCRQRGVMYDPSRCEELERVRDAEIEAVQATLRAGAHQ